MSRSRVRAYRSTEVADLARQLLYAPKDKRAQAVLHAERFHDEIDPQKNYPIDYVVYRLTGRRVPPSESVMLAGEALAPDLRLFIDALSRTVELAATADDPCETTKELAARLGVSTKTVARWRDAGLRWRWGIRLAGDKPGVLFPRSAVEAFRRARAERVDAAGRFARMDEAEKRRLIERARRLAQVIDAAPQRIYEHLAKRTGRSVEALRQLITGHDTAHPDDAVFGDRPGPLTDKQKRVIDRAYQRGVTVSAMCRRFGKTRSTIYRAVNEQRAERALAVQIEPVYSLIFDRDDADEVLMQPIKRTGRPRRLDEDVIATLPEPLGPIYAHRIDSDAVTRSLVVRYNFIRHRAKKLQEQIAQPPVRAGDLDRFDDLIGRADAARAEVLAGTLPIVLSVVRRQMVGGVHQSEGALLSLLDRGNRVLVHEVERFDASRSHKFESVLTNRLLRELAKADEPRHRLDVQSLIQRLARAGLVVAAD